MTWTPQGQLKAPVAAEDITSGTLDEDRLPDLSLLYATTQSVADNATTDYVDAAVDAGKPVHLGPTDAIPGGTPSGVLVIRSLA